MWRTVTSAWFYLTWKLMHAVSWMLAENIRSLKQRQITFLLAAQQALNFIFVLVPDVSRLQSNAEGSTGRLHTMHDVTLCFRRQTLIWKDSPLLSQAEITLTFVQRDKVPKVAHWEHNPGTCLRNRVVQDLIFRKNRWGRLGTMVEIQKYLREWRTKKNK